MTYREVCYEERRRTGEELVCDKEQGNPEWIRAGLWQKRYEDRKYARMLTVEMAEVRKVTRRGELKFKTEEVLLTQRETVELYGPILLEIEVEARKMHVCQITFLRVSYWAYLWIFAPNGYRPLHTKFDSWASELLANRMLPTTTRLPDVDCAKWIGDLPPYMIMGKQLGTATNDDGKSGCCCY